MTARTILEYNSPDDEELDRPVRVPDWTAAAVLQKRLVGWDTFAGIADIAEEPRVVAADARVKTEVADEEGN